MNEVFIVGKLANKITTNTLIVLINEKQLFKCVINKDSMYDTLINYANINDGIGVKGHLEIINNEMCVICDKVTICKKKGEQNND